MQFPPLFSRSTSFKIVCLLALTSICRAEETRDHNVTLDDYFSLAYLPEAVTSPDGRYIAYAQALWQESTDDRKADIWVVDTRSRLTKRLTFDREGYNSLKWSRDSKLLFFLGNRNREGATKPPFDGKTQIWRLTIDGDELIPVTSAPEGVDQFDLSGDSNDVYYSTSSNGPQKEWSALKNQFPEIVYGHRAEPITKITRLNMNDWRTEQVATIRCAVSELAVSPDGRYLALITAPEEAVISFEGKSRIDLIRLNTQQTTTLPDKLWRAEAPSPYGRLESLTWSDDSQALSFVIAFDGFPSEIIIARFSNEQPSLARLKRPTDISLLANVDMPLMMHWRRGSSELCFLGEQGGRIRIYSALQLTDAQQASVSCLTPGDVAVDSFSFDYSGDQIGAIVGDPTRFADICLFGPSGIVQRITNVNPQTKRWKLPRSSIVSWKGADNVPVEGILEIPPNATEGEKLPMIVVIHGGPTASSPFRLLYDYFGHGLYSFSDYAVLSPNYRGSTGYGDNFLTDLIGHENERDVDDILKGVDAMVERGIADPDRLGVSGWSNGGFLTNCIIARTNRFKAASSGAGVAETLLEWGASDEPGFTMAFLQGFPWAKALEYSKASPVFELGPVQTPTLFHVGENDPRCPSVNSRTLFRALSTYLSIPTELLIYPKEPHNLGGYRSRKAKMTWDLAWFDHYIRGKGSDK
jgi:dipeptidyl aminopeptidase/acylaminoacyl peptidase